MRIFWENNWGLNFDEWVSNESSLTSRHERGEAMLYFQRWIGSRKYLNESLEICFWIITKILISFSNTYQSIQVNKILDFFEPWWICFFLSRKILLKTWVRTSAHQYARICSSTNGGFRVRICSHPSFLVNSNHPIKSIVFDLLWDQPEEETKSLNY